MDAETLVEISDLVEGCSGEEAANEQVNEKKRRRGKRIWRRFATRAENFNLEPARKPGRHLRSSKIDLKGRRRIGRFSERPSGTNSSNK